MSTGRTEKHRETTVWSLIILNDFTVVSGDSWQQNGGGVRAGRCSLLGDVELRKKWRANLPLGNTR